MKEMAVKDLKRGECLYRQKGNLTCVTWRDRKTVSVLATLPARTRLEPGSAISKSKWEVGEEAIY